MQHVANLALLCRLSNQAETNGCKSETGATSYRGCVLWQKSEAIKMKKLYEVPELKVSLLDRADVIVTSGEDGEEDELPL